MAGAGRGGEGSPQGPLPHLRWWPQLIQNGGSPEQGERTGRRGEGGPRRGGRRKEKMEERRGERRGRRSKWRGRREERRRGR